MLLFPFLALSVTNKLVWKMLPLSLWSLNSQMIWTHNCKWRRHDPTTTTTRAQIHKFEPSEKCQKQRERLFSDFTATCPDEGCFSHWLSIHSFKQESLAFLIYHYLTFVYYVVRSSEILLTAIMWGNAQAFLDAHLENTRGKEFNPKETVKPFTYFYNLW